MDIFYDMSLYKPKQKNRIQKVNMHFTSTTILSDLDLTVYGKKDFEENGELSIASFRSNVRHAYLRSDLVLFISDSLKTYILKNRYGDTGIVKTGKYYGA